LVDRDGDPVPLWYGAGDDEGAVFESVFHDVPFDSPDPRVLRPSFATRVLSPARTARPLDLIDLTSAGLRRVHLARADLIESDAARYPWTRDRAVELRAAAVWAHGMVWVARQHDRSLAFILFGDRLPAGALEEDPGGGGPVPLGAGAGLELVETLANRAGIAIAEP